MRAQDIIERLDLKPLPHEGGHYRETYRDARILPQGAFTPRRQADKRISSAIYYLLTAQTESLLHRLPSDEIFHFYLGDPVIMLQLYPNGDAKRLTLGQDIQAGQLVQCVVPAGVWQGMYLKPGGTVALMGTTVAPAFDFDDLELGDRKILISGYPKYEELIKRLTKENGS